MSKITSIKDLKEAKYNPRFITGRRLKDLEESFGTFGDLSGVVFNGHKKSRNLISGHQRLKSIRGWKTVLKLKDHDDDYGTVQLGFIIATHPKTKSKLHIPLRIVDWSDKKAEYAANIAANAHGGEFDNKKLGKLVEKLDLSTIPTGVLGLDPLELRGLRQLVGEDKGKTEAGAAKASGKRNGASGSFTEYREEDVGNDLDHTCPRCSFKF